jgi:hypothetical protein
MKTPLSFELAKLLKEKEYDVENRYQLQMYGSQHVPQLEPYNDTKWNIYKNYYLAPTIAEVVMWLYEKHGIWVEVIETDLFNKFFFQIKRKDNTKLKNGDFNSPTETYENAIEYVLNNLI